MQLVMSLLKAGRDLVLLVTVVSGAPGAEAQVWLMAGGVCWW